MASTYAPKLAFGHGIVNATASLPCRNLTQLSHGWDLEEVTGVWIFYRPCDGPQAWGQRSYQRFRCYTAGARAKIWTPVSETGQCPGFSTRRELMVLVIRATDFAANGWIKGRVRYVKADGTVGWTSGDFISLTGPVAAWSLQTGELYHSGGEGIATQIELEVYGGSAAGTRTLDLAFASVALWTSTASTVTLDAPRVAGTSCRPIDSGKVKSGYAWGRAFTPAPGRRHSLALELSWGGATDTTKQALERAYAGSVEAGYQPGGWDGQGSWAGMASPSGVAMPLLVMPDLPSFPLAGLYEFDGAPAISLAGSGMQDPPVWNINARLVEVL